MTDCDELGHGNNTTLLYLLVDILLLQLGKDTRVQFVDDILEDWVQIARDIPQLMDEETSDSKSVADNSGL